MVFRNAIQQDTGIAQRLFAMKKIRIRHTNGTDLTRLFSAKILGGGRGFDENTLALETFSNDFTPTIKCLQGFTLIVEVEDEKDSDTF